MPADDLVHLVIESAESMNLTTLKFNRRGAGSEQYPPKMMLALRRQSVEPVFGIIKNVMGFRRFLLRGLATVFGEWSLVALAYNLKRLWRLRPIIAN